jgi:phosphodiesterase/alkaline phosphatase D-like protein
VKDRFTAFELTGLLPDTEISVSFRGVSGPVPGKFKTFAAVPGRMNIGAVSCNFTIRRDDTDLWADLRDRNVNLGNVELLLHVGDQIYGDNAFQEAGTILDGRRVGAQAQQRRIRELYRRLYRVTWRHPATRNVLASVPNLMIWDDHEIRDDWGSRPTHKDTASAVNHIGSLSHDIFREHQRQLFDNQANWPSYRFEDHCHKWGP